MFRCHPKASRGHRRDFLNMAGSNAGTDSRCSARLKGTRMKCVGAARPESPG